MLNMILALHIAGGSIALASMVLPMISRKGATLHRRSGWVFVGGMTIVSVTAFVLSTSRLLTDPTPAGRSAGAFLFYVSVLTAAGVSAGVRVLAQKKRTGAHRHPWDVGISATLVVSSIAFAAWGFASGRTLFMVFPIIGLVTGGNQLAYWLRPPSHPMHWWFEHMGAMLGSCIAATTAFLVVNAERLGLQTFGLVVWIAPAIVGAPGIAIWSTYYRRRFSQSIPSTRKVATTIMAGAVPKSS